MKKRLPLDITIFILILIITVSSLVGGQNLLTSEEDAINIPTGGYASLPFQASRGDTFAYNFTVMDGPNIDILIVWNRDLSKFQAGETYGNYAPRTHMNASSGNYEFWIPDDARYYLIFDNGYRSEILPDGNTVRNATVLYSTQVLVRQGLLVEEVIMMGSMFTAIIIVSVLFYLEKKHVRNTQFTPVDQYRDKRKPLRMKWDHWNLIRIETKKVWLKGIHKYLYYLGLGIAIIGILIFYPFVHEIITNFVYIVLYFFLISLLYIAELTRLAIIEYRAHKLISTAVFVPLLITSYVVGAYEITEDIFWGFNLFIYAAIMIAFWLYDVVSTKPPIPAAIPQTDEEVHHES